MIDEFAYLGFPLEPSEVCKIAFDFAKENGIVGFSDDLERAGRSWFSYLLQRWPKLTVKSATNISLQCARASSQETVMLWFEKFINVLGQLGINSPEYIWNVDEHGTEHTVKSKRVVGIKNVRQFQKQMHEKPCRTTMVTYVNTNGYALPPLIIHKGRYSSTWTRGLMPGAIVRSSKKGYINKELFADYGTRLIYHLYAKGMLGNGQRHLILMDSHYSHVFNYCFMKMMYDRNIKVLALPPHTSHWAQPLDKNPFSAFKEHFNKQMRKFLRQSGGRPLKKDEYNALFNVSWVKAMTPQNIKAGFKRTGIWPPDPNVIPHELFAVAKKSESNSVSKVFKFHHSWTLFYSFSSFYVLYCSLFCFSTSPLCNQIMCFHFQQAQVLHHLWGQLQHHQQQLMTMTMMMTMMMMKLMIWTITCKTAAAAKKMKMLLVSRSKTNRFYKLDQKNHLF